MWFSTWFLDTKSVDLLDCVCLGPGGLGLSPEWHYFYVSIFILYLLRMFTLGTDDNNYGYFDGT